MTSGVLLRQTVVGCAILAVAGAAVASAAGHVAWGVGIAAGLLLGSLNGFLIQGLLGRGTPFVAASLLRLVFFTSLVLIAAVMLRGQAWALALGIGLAQLVMVTVAIRRGLRP